MVWTELAFWLIDMLMVLWLVNQSDTIILMQISGEAGRENECSSYHAGQKSDVHEESYQSAVLETETPLGYATDRSMVMFLSLQDRKFAALSAIFFRRKARKATGSEVCAPRACSRNRLSSVLGSNLIGGSVARIIVDGSLARAYKSMGNKQGVREQSWSSDSYRGMQR
jgi:hypothetical protein